MVQVIHPSVVHFPVALIIFSGIVAIADIIHGGHRLKTVLTWALAASVIGAALAVAAGLRDAGLIPHNETIHKIMEVHEKIGISILVLTAILFTWLMIRKQAMGNLENLVFVIILWAGLGLVTYNAYLGGKMVYDYGAGIKPMQNTFIKEGHHHHDE